EAPSLRDNRVVETSLPEHLHLLWCNVHAVVARVRSLERDDLTHVLAPPIGWLIRPRAPPQDDGGAGPPFRLRPVPGPAASGPLPAPQPAGRHRWWGVPLRA